MVPRQSNKSVCHLIQRLVYGNGGSGSLAPFATRTRVVKLVRRPSVMLIAVTRWLQVNFVRAELARARFNEDRQATMEAELELGRLLGEDQRWDEAESALTEARKLGIELGNLDAIGRSGIGLAAILIARQDYRGAYVALEAELPRLRKLGDRRMLADALLKFGVANDKVGRVGEALASWERALMEANAGGDPFRQSEALMNLGGLAYREQRYENAQRYWVEALALCRRRHDLGNAAEMTFFLGVVSRRLGQLDEAHQFLAESTALYKRIGRPELAIRSKEYLAGLETDTAKPAT